MDKNPASLLKYINLWKPVWTVAPREMKSIVSSRITMEIKCTLEHGGLQGMSVWAKDTTKIVSMDSVNLRD